MYDAKYTLLSFLMQFSLDGETKTVSVAYIDLLYIRILCFDEYIYHLNITYPGNYIALYLIVY